MPEIKHVAEQAARALETARRQGPMPRLASPGWAKTAPPPPQRSMSSAYPIEAAHIQDSSRLRATEAPCPYGEIRPDMNRATATGQGKVDPSAPQECLNDPHCELRPWSLRAGVPESELLWPYCTICDCWSSIAHIQGNKHARSGRAAAAAQTSRTPQSSPVAASATHPIRAAGIPPTAVISANASSSGRCEPKPRHAAPTSQSASSALRWLEAGYAELGNDRVGEVILEEAPDSRIPPPPHGQPSAFQQGAPPPPSQRASGQTPDEVARYPQTMPCPSGQPFVEIEV
eukprot:gnl/TRDRNA2_/TRDRNA2_167332_c0_seq4.p1 gnl/TRDRNA2_/TRDRNA2_167332_c0~~gnl/TRDRNA2_/TRDRNA2_167332_c0_seq4.p1  ORF type:complete len:288 (+),score=37.56 gnl/TRDRNA2_/TRDRNA2_167332_c0_seq4:290-1153(+)